MRKRNLTIRLIHLFHIVDPGLILAKHIFQGLKRPLLYGDDENGDKAKLIFTWPAKYDWDYDQGKRFESDGLTRRDAPPNTVFGVIATPNASPEFPNVDYWLDSWCWIDASPTLPGAPIDWETRYDSKLS